MVAVIVCYCDIVNLGQHLKPPSRSMERINSGRALFRCNTSSHGSSTGSNGIEDIVVTGNMHLDMGQSAVSHQLRILRAAGLVRPRRSGKTVYYALDDDHVREILESGLEHILHKQQYNVKQGK